MRAARKRGAAAARDRDLKDTEVLVNYIMLLYYYYYYCYCCYCCYYYCHHYYF